MAYTYKLAPNDPVTGSPTGEIFKIEDGVVTLIGRPESLADYQAWLAEGNTPLPADD